MYWYGKDIWWLFKCSQCNDRIICCWSNIAAICCSIVERAGKTSQLANHVLCETAAGVCVALGVLCVDESLMCCRQLMSSHSNSKHCFYLVCTSSACAQRTGAAALTSSLRRDGPGGLASPAFHSRGNTSPFRAHLCFYVNCALYYFRIYLYLILFH